MDDPVHPSQSPPDAQPSGIELAPNVRAAPHSLRIQFSRGSGPGGQNVNKLNTRAELWIAVTALIGMNAAAQNRLRIAAGKRLTAGDELHLSSDTHRTQQANVAEIMDRLREMIVAARHEPKRRRKTRPSLASKRRRLESKRHRSKIKSNRRNED